MFVEKNGHFLSHFVIRNSRNCHPTLFFDVKEKETEAFQGLAGNLSWHDLCYITSEVNQN